MITPHADPFTHFNAWFDKAESDTSIDAEAMALATAANDAKPSVRMVYFRGMSTAKQIKFYSNYNSRKGQELATNTHAALLFYWYPLNRQIRIEGTVKRMSAKQSASYFASRPLPSQVSSYLSQQSRRIKSYQDFERQFAAKLAKTTTSLACPSHWGGYLLTPDRFEFYCGHPHRLNERLIYEHSNDVWDIFNVSP
ncbi:MAG: pyridoxamine 5'-phosphate oxidase [Pseudomonadota bacterium]|nr:pyridoxamine 5'-phosphate oxidase [Pseudomonadota bacterium]